MSNLEMSIEMLIVILLFSVLGTGIVKVGRGLLMFFIARKVRLYLLHKGNCMTYRDSHPKFRSAIKFVENDLMSENYMFHGFYKKYAHRDPKRVQISGVWTILVGLFLMTVGIAGLIMTFTPAK